MNEKHCSDERPCTPCFSDSGPCEDSPKECALSGMFPGLQSGLEKLTTGARLMDGFHSADWNQVRESLEARVIAASSALMAHTEAAGMTLEKDGGSVQIALVGYEGEKS